MPTPASRANLDHCVSQGSDIDYTTLNEIFGIELFQDNNLWDDKAERLSIMFANKGDFFGTESEIKKAIKADADLIKSKLIELLGKPKYDSFGRGRDLRERVDRWDWGSHAILLSEQAGEYPSLRTMHTKLADNKGIGPRVTDADLRDKLEGNIEKNKNGDVVVKNIPMVDQGPKGYCVPATFERYLRYMGLPADMYILAMAGGTTDAEGTDIYYIVNNIKRYIGSMGRDLTSVDGDMTIRNIAHYIDNGLPIMWCLFSNLRFNTIATIRTEKRKSVTDWKKWKMHCREENRYAENMNYAEDPHICMIIGYNADTKEIAISDSEGTAFELR